MSAGSRGVRLRRVVRAAALRSLAALSLGATLFLGAQPTAASPTPRGINPEVALADLVVAHWTTADGLPTNTLLDVRQVSTGELWLSGFGGLARFDGVDFEVFNQRTTPELETSSFYAVVEHANTLWIASQTKGVLRFEDERLTRAFPDHPSTLVRSLLVDRRGILWIGTADQGAFRVLGERVVALDHPALIGGSVRVVFEDRQGQLWFGTRRRGLVRMTEGRFTTFGEGTGLIGDSITSLLDTADGTLWIGTRTGLRRLSDGVVHTVPELEGVEIYQLRQDDYGSFWIAAEQGLYRRTPSSQDFEHLDTLHGQSLRSANGFAFDHEGAVWVSTYQSGLFRLGESQFRNYTLEDGLGSRRVNSVFEWRPDKFLVGGDLGAIDVIENGTISPLRLETRLPDVRVRDFFEDSRGTLWISSYAGLLRLRDGRETLLTVASGLPVDQVRLVYEDSKGTLWAGTRGGGLVKLLDDGGMEVVDSSNGLAADYVLALAEDGDGRLLIGTRGGLSVMGAGGEITNFTTDDGLPADLVFNIFVDDENTVWLSTTGGLGRIRDGRIRALTGEQGLPTDAVYDYLEDDYGHVWMTSSQGVIRVAKTDLEDTLDGRRATLRYRVLDQADGMKETQCTGATALQEAADGTLWIPTLDGLAVIDPRRVGGARAAPPVLIRRVTIDGEESVQPGGEGEVIEVSSSHRRFDFAFAVLSFQAPEKVRVRYRLEGFDREWIEAEGERSARYNGLGPGEYSFEVEAAGDDGSLSSARVALRLEPRFYQTPFFVLLAAATLLVGPWALYRWQVARTRRRSQLLEGLLSEQRRLERERIQLIQKLESRNEQLEQLTYAVSHDLKSPLFTIHGFLALLEKDRAAGDEQQVESDIRRIRQAAASMGRLLEELSKLWRMESSEIHLERTDVGELVRQAVAAVQGRLSEGGVEVRIEPDLPAAIVEPTQIMEVFQNLVENAARFMGDQAEPLIEIGCRRGSESDIFFVRDNGIGIEPKFHDKVFRIFDRLESAPDGTGLGLAIVKRVVEAHGGRVWVESQGVGTGSTFCFTLEPQTPLMG